MNTETAEKRAIKERISNKSLNLKWFKKTWILHSSNGLREMFSPLPPFVKVCVFSLVCLPKSAFCVSVFRLTFIFIIFCLK